MVDLSCRIENRLSGVFDHISAVLCVKLAACYFRCSNWLSVPFWFCERIGVTLCIGYRLQILDFSVPTKFNVGLVIVLFRCFGGKVMVSLLHRHSFRNFEVDPTIGVFVSPRRIFNRWFFCTSEMC